MAKVGRKGLYTPKMVNAICSHLAAGLTVKDTLNSIGLNHDSYYQWLKKYPEFAEKVEKASLSLKKYHIENITRASTKSWQASAWWLERKHPEEFSLKYEVNNKHEFNWSKLADEYDGKDFKKEVK